VWLVGGIIVYSLVKRGGGLLMVLVMLIFLADLTNGLC